MIGFRDLRLGMLMLCLLALTGCLGGGGGGGDSSSTTNELTSLRVTNDEQPADGVSAITLTLTARNEDGTVYSGAEIALAASSDNALFSSVSGTTDANGRFVVTVTNDVAETVSVTAFIDGVSASSASFTFVPVTTESTTQNVSFSVINNGQPANGSAEITLTAIARNANGTALSGLALALATDSDTAIFSSLSGNTDATGRFSVTVTNSVAETVSVNAFVESELVASTQLNFNTIDNRISLSVTDNQQPADGAAEISVSVIARNADGTALQGAAVELASSSDTALFSAMRGTTDGTGRFIVTVTNTVEETVTMTAFVNDASVGELQLIFLAENANSAITEVELVVTRNFQAANGTSSTLLTVIARDANNLPLANVPVSLSSDSTSASFDSLTGFTEEDGRFSTSIRDSVAEVVTVIATAGGLDSDSVEVTFVSQVDEITLSSSDRVLALGDTATLIATVLKEPSISDVNNAGTTPLPDTPVTVSVSGAAILGNVPERTDENGQIEFTVTDRSAETVVVRVTSRTITQTLELYFGASLQLVPSISNAVGSVEVTALLKDGNNTPLSGQAVIFGFDNENSESLSDRSINTNADGTAIITVTDVAGDGGRALVRASIGTLSASAEVNFRANFQGGARQLTATQSATVLTLDQAATVTATITDANGFPVAGQLVEFSVSTPSGDSSPAQLSSVSGTSDDNGIVQTQITSSVATNAQVTVQASTAQQALTLYFGARLNLSPTQARGVVGTEDSITLTASLVDADQVGIAGIPLKFRLNSGEALLSEFNPITDAQGQAEVGVRQRTSGESVVSVSTDNLASASATLTFVPDAADSILLSITPTDLSINGTASITANVLDAFGNPMPVGTRVEFATNGIGTITSSALTDANGDAVATFTAATQAGLVTITASSDGASATANLTVHPASAGIIELDNVTPQVIGIDGSGTVQSSLITFRVRDNLGNPVEDGTEVQFALGSTTLGGGESIATGDEVGSNSTVGYTNSEGLVSVSLKSGKVAGNVDVVASINNISAAARVTIVGGVPDLDRFSLAVEYLNIAGGVTFGLQDTVTAFVGDRFGNVVSDETGVSFITEGGTIGTSIGTGAFSTTTSFGQASAVLQTANPAPPLLGGLPTLFRTANSSFSANYDCGTFAFVSNASTGQSLCGNPSVTTIVAYTSGSESFIDNDGNGVFDALIDQHSELGYQDDNNNGRWDQGEIITERGDSSEPYIDANDNRTFDSGEFYIDVNSNSRFDGPDGLFQDNTTIWHSIRVLFSSTTAPLVVTTSNGDNPNGFQIPNGGSLTFVLQALSDQYGNALVSGTRFNVRASNGVLAGSADFTFEDSTARGFSGLTFTLASNAPSVSETEAGTVFTYPDADSATITITVTTPSGDTGGNGSLEMSFSGTINVP